jgi:Domain of unknown function (DUF4826)
MLDYDDQEVEAQWFADRRMEVFEYLKGEGVAHGQIGMTPAWHVAPYASIWAVASLASPGRLGWWAISGDLPNDYVSADNLKNPREAVEAIASLWKEAAEFMARGERHPTFVIGTGDRTEELAPLLASRAELLLEWVSDPEAWDENES